MANHGFITTRKNLTIDHLMAMINEINLVRFKGKLSVSLRDSVAIIALSESETMEIPFWLASKRKIETRHSFNGDMGWWVSSVFTNEIALKIGGTISDEGVSEKWKGSPDQYPTLKSWLDSIYRTRLSKAMALQSARRFKHLREFIR